MALDTLSFSPTIKEITRFENNNNQSVFNPYHEITPAHFAHLSEYVENSFSDSTNEKSLHGEIFILFPSLRTKIPNKTKLEKTMYSNVTHFRKELKNTVKEQPNVAENILNIGDVLLDRSNALFNCNPHIFTPVKDEFYKELIPYINALKQELQSGDALFDTNVISLSRLVSHFPEKRREILRDIDKDTLFSFNKRYVDENPSAKEKAISFAASLRLMYPELQFIDTVYSRSSLKNFKMMLLENNDTFTINPAPLVNLAIISADSISLGESGIVLSFTPPLPKETAKPITRGF